MNNNSKTIKYIAFSSSTILFLFLNFILGPKTMFGLDQCLLKLTNYFFGMTLYTFDYLILALIPIISLGIKNERNNLSVYLFNSFIIILNTTIFFCIGTILLIWLGKFENPLIPQYLLVEPFKLYSTLFICFGAIFPLVLNVLRKK